MSVGVGEQDAVLEPEVDVLPLGPDPGEVPDATALGERVGDPAPAWPDGLGRAGHRPEDQAPQCEAGFADRRRIPVEQELRRQRLGHATIILPRTHARLRPVQQQREPLAPGQGGDPRPFADERDRRARGSISAGDANVSQRTCFVSPAPWRSRSGSSMKTPHSKPRWTWLGSGAT